MAKFKVILERVETIIQQGAVMVEASTAEEARETIRAGDITVAVENRHDPLELPDPWRTEAAIETLTAGAMA